MTNLLPKTTSFRKGQRVMDENKREYLSLIQEPIGRMSTASSIFKGFAATIVTGTAALSYADVKLVVLILSFIPIFTFAALDLYYLRLERLYRGLYNAVLNGDHPVNYQIMPPKDKAFIKKSKATLWQCMTSPSIWLFYPAMIVILIIISLLKICGGI